jgi:hypothetical protein
LYKNFAQKLTANNLAHLSAAMDTTDGFYDQKWGFAEAVSKNADADKKIEYIKLASDRGLIKETSKHHSSTAAMTTAYILSSMKGNPQQVEKALHELGSYNEAQTVLKAAKRSPTAGGLSHDVMKAVGGELNLFAATASSEELIARMQDYNDKVAKDPNTRHEAMKEATALMAAVGNRASPEVQREFLNAVARMDQFKAVGRLNEFKSVWGDNPEKRFAIASMLIQDPNMSPETLENAQDMARLSADVYAPKNPERYGKPVCDGKYVVVDPKDVGMDRSRFENNYTGFRAQLYRNTETGEYVLAFAGSNEMIRDYGSANIPQAFGLLSTQYLAAMSLAEDLQGKLGERGEQLTDITGHSLGGGLASAASMVTGVNATTFNAAGVHFGTLFWKGKLYRYNPNSNQITNYRVRGEALTAAQENLLIDAAKLALSPADPWAVPDAAGKQITIEVFDSDNMLTDAEVTMARKDLHGQKYMLWGMLVA